MDKSAARVARRFLERVGMEHASPEALKKYMHDHPNADPKHHTVKKKTDEEQDAEAEEMVKPLEQKVKEKVKGWGAKALSFMKSAPKAVQEFVSDQNSRNKTLHAAHAALTSAPEKMLKQVRETVKEEVHEYKEAAHGIKAYLKGGEMSKEQTKALKTVGMHLAIGITAAALTASGPVGVAGAFTKGLVKHVALKAVTHAMGHLHVLEELGHIGHGVQHLMDHMASTADPRSPEAVLQRYLQAAAEGKDVDPDEVLSNFFAAAVAKNMKSLSDEDLKAVVSDLGEGKEDKEEKKDAPKTEKEARLLQRVTSRYLSNGKT